MDMSLSVPVGPETFLFLPLLAIFSHDLVRSVGRRRRPTLPAGTEKQNVYVTIFDELHFSLLAVRTSNCIYARKLAKDTFRTAMEEIETAAGKFERG